MRRLGCIVTAWLFLALLSFGFQGRTSLGSENPQIDREVRQAWLRFTSQHGREWRATWDPAVGTLKSLRGARYRRIGGEPEEVARRFLVENRDLFLVQPDLSDLSLDYLKRSPAGIHVGFRQNYRGLPVFHGGIEIHMTSTSQVFLVQNSYAPVKLLGRLQLAPSLSPGHALAAANEAYRKLKLSNFRGAPFSASQPASASRAELGLYRTDIGFRLAYRLRVGVVRYLVDAHTGKILGQMVLVQSFVDGTAKVFDPNPVNTLANTGLENQNDQNYSALNGAYFTDVLEDITQTGMKYKLWGPYVKALNLQNDSCFTALGYTSVPKPPPARGDTNFSFTRNKVGFEHVMAYFHIDRNQRYIQSLGFTDASNRQIIVDAHAFAQWDALYCATPIGSGYLVFGDGQIAVGQQTIDFVDAAEDADAILHEYAHAVQDNQVRDGKYLVPGEPRAQAEGFADYWAYTNGPTALTNFDPYCFAEWFAQGTSLGECVRRLDRSKHYPESMVGEPHQDGEIWSRALTDIFAAVGKPITDKLVLASHYLVPSAPSFRDGAQALVDADQVLFGGIHWGAIAKAMNDRGIIVPWPPVNKIVFYSLRDGNAEIYIMHPDGTNQTRLTNHTASDAFPALSPDGQKIAFASTRDGNLQEIYLMNVDGTGVQRLTTNAVHDEFPAWSPDGRRITFECGEKICIINADGTGYAQLFSDPDDNMSYPSFNPDGTKIVFMYCPSNDCDIYTIDADGTDPSPVTTGTAADADPDFSPDGSKIAFVSNRDNGYWDIYYMNADGSGITRVTTDNQDADLYPTFDPSSTRIAFTSRRSSNDDVYSIDLDGTDLIRLTTNFWGDETPDWR